MRLSAKTVGYEAKITIDSPICNQKTFYGSMRGKGHDRDEGPKEIEI